MSRVSLARRAITVTAGTMVLMGAMLVPFAGVAAAASTNCPSSEGTQCYLRISSPNSVQTGTNFLLRVLVTTDFPARTTVASTDPCGKNAAVSIFVDTAETPTQTHNASGGVAYFVLNFGSAGPHTVVADATPSHDWPDGSCSTTYFQSDSRTIQAVQSSIPLAPCPPDVSCVQTTSTTGTGATLVARDGTFTGAPFPPNFWNTEAVAMPGPSVGGPAAATTTAPDPNGCHDFGPPDPQGVLGFHLNGTSSSVKFIVYAFDPSPGLYTKPINKYDICWDQDQLFTPKGGGPQVNRGYLPNCNFWDDRWERWEHDEDGGHRAGPPCILFRLATRKAKYIVVIAPTTAGGDPFGYGH